MLQLVENWRRYTVLERNAKIRTLLPNASYLGRLLPAAAEGFDGVTAVRHDSSPNDEQAPFFWHTMVAGGGGEEACFFFLICLLRNRCIIITQEGCAKKGILWHSSTYMEAGPRSCCRACFLDTYTSVGTTTFVGRAYRKPARKRGEEEADDIKEDAKKSRGAATSYGEEPNTNVDTTRCCRRGQRSKQQERASGS